MFYGTVILLFLFIITMKGYNQKTNFLFVRGLGESEKGRLDMETQEENIVRV